MNNLLWIFGTALISESSECCYKNMGHTVVAQDVGAYIAYWRIAREKIKLGSSNILFLVLMQTTAKPHTGIND
jgi:hypothetical protein